MAAEGGVTCDACARPGLYVLSCIPCCLRLIASAPPGPHQRVMGAVIERQMGANHLRDVREAWHEARGKS
jgi:hypothetical protein